MTSHLGEQRSAVPDPRSPGEPPVIFSKNLMILLLSQVSRTCFLCLVCARSRVSIAGTARRGLTEGEAVLFFLCQLAAA